MTAVVPCSPEPSARLSGQPLPAAGTPPVGRFAPSPSGPLHLGSLVAALGSWLAARHAGGRWLVRIEDLDTPRNMPGADEAILASLVAHGLTWDGAPVWQSTRLEAYQAALDRLTGAGLAYPCGCSRREVGGSDVRYAGTCRNGLAPGRPPRAWRLRCPAGPVAFDDAVLGPQSEDVADRVGDFVIRRADGIFAYQLAVVVDDAWQGVTEVVRGYDLFDSTGRQCLLQDCLRLPRPRYLHLPLVMGADGQKLSKQNRAAPLEPGAARDNLLQALHWLGQPSPTPEARSSVESVLRHAVAHWHPPAAMLVASTSS